MAGPWEQYQSADGPWSAYQKPKEQPRPDPSAGGGTLRPFGIDTGIQTPQWLDRGLAGVGKAFSDLGTGASQFGAGVADLVAPRQTSITDLILSRKPMSRVDEMRQQVAETRRLDAPLMDTAAGKVGNIGGNVAMLAPSALIPGANTYTGAATIGAITGALQPSESTGETLTNIGLGGAGGAAGQGIANAAGKYIANQATKAAAAQAANAQKVAAAQSAAKAGYVIPPEDLGGGALTKLASGLSGKIKTAQEASARNQSVTNSLVKQELGLAPDAPVDIGVLNGIRSKAGQAYDAVASAGTINPGKSYEAALDKIVAPYQKAAQGFPGAKPNPIIAEIDAIRSPQFDAASAVAKIKELRSSADTAYAQGNKDLGKALKDGANALEGAIDDHLTTIGAPPDLLQNFRDARQLIAKTYTAQKALNTQTGDFNAQVLAKELGKGRPLSGDIKTAAEAAQAFPKATQALKEAPKSLSPLDFATAGGMLAGTGGNPLAAAGLLARPGIRSALLSGPVQRNALANAGALQSPNMLARLLQNEPAALPLGVLSGTGLANYLSQQ